MTQTNVEMAPKRLEFLHELLPAARVVTLLVNPNNPSIVEAQVNEIGSAAQALGLELHILNVSTEHDFDAIFANLTELREGGLVISSDPLFTGRSEQLATLAARHAVPAVYKGREFAVAGGLLSYGASVADTYRLAGTYVGRILKGDKPADLPVQQPTKVELIINLKAAKALGITFPLTLLGRADEGDRVKRREFITLLGSTAATWPLAARAQRATVPVVGFLNPGSPEATRYQAVAFVQGMEPGRICRGPKRCGRVPLGERPIRSITTAIAADPGFAVRSP